MDEENDESWLRFHHITIMKFKNVIRFEWITSLVNLPLTFFISQAFSSSPFLSINFISSAPYKGGGGRSESINSLSIRCGSRCDSEMREHKEIMTMCSLWDKQQIRDNRSHGGFLCANNKTPTGNSEFDAWWSKSKTAQIIIFFTLWQLYFKVIISLFLCTILPTLT